MSHSTQNGHFGDVPQANLLAWYGKLNLTQQKHTLTNEKKCRTTQKEHKKLQPGSVASYDIRPGSGWLEFNIPFQHKYGYIRDERSGVESYPLTQRRKASNILTLTLAAFLFSSHPKKGKRSRCLFKLLR